MFWEQENLIDDQYVSVIGSQDVDKINLEELIDKIPNLINNYDVGDERIIQILKRKDILENLIRNVTELPPEHLDENERFKYANTSCCLFLSKTTKIEEELIKNYDLLDKLLDFLQTDDNNLNPLMTSFFSNTLFSLYTKFNLEMIDYFNQNKLDLFDQLFKHINISAILDLLIKLITLESIDSKRTVDVYNWLNKQNLIQKIVNLFKSNNIDSNGLENASNLLIHLIERGRQSIIYLDEEKKFYQFIYSEHIINELINTIDNHEQSLIHILRILVQFVDYEYHFKLISDIKTKLLTIEGNLIDTPQHLLDSIETSANTLTSCEYISSIKNIHRIILNNLDKFKQLLINSIPNYSVKTSFGLIEKPLGFVRLEIINLIYALLNANNPEMNQAIADAKIIEIIIDLFFEYEFNSFLHNHVNNIIITLFLNANDNRFKLFTNKDRKDEFLKLDLIKLKELNFIEIVNYAWSDSDCFEHVLKLMKELDDQIIIDKFKTNINELYFSKSKLKYTSLISQLFIDCNLIERIMKTYKSIIDRIPVPTFKSNLIEFAEIIDKFLIDYESAIVDQQFINDQLKIEWTDFKIKNLDQVKNKIIDVENSFKNEENAKLNFREFSKQNRCKRIDIPYNILKKMQITDFEFGLNPFGTQFDRDFNNLNFNLNPELSNLDRIDRDMYFKKFGNQIKNLISIDDQKYDEPNTSTNDNIINQHNTTDLKFETTIKDNNEQSTSNNSSLISNSFKDNLFNPLASSSNISNELNIEMDVNISKDDDDIVNSKNINECLEEKKDNQ